MDSQISNSSGQLKNGSIRVFINGQRINLAPDKAVARRQTLPLAKNPQPSPKEEGGRAIPRRECSPEMRALISIVKPPPEQHKCPPKNPMSIQLLKLFGHISGQVADIMVYNGMPAEMAKMEAAAFIRAGNDALRWTIDSNINRFDWLKSPLLDEAVTKLVGPDRSQWRIASVSGLLRSQKLYTMSSIAKENGLISSTRLLKHLCQQGIIYHDGNKWKPAAEFEGKQLFAEGKTLAAMNKLHCTLRGRCFVYVLLSHPELNPMDAYLQTFTTEVL